MIMVKKVVLLYVTLNISLVKIIAQYSLVEDLYHYIDITIDVVLRTHTYNISKTS